MNIFTATLAYNIVVTDIAHAIIIEPGFPTDCGVPAVHQVHNSAASQIKVTASPYVWPWNVGLWSETVGSYPYCGGALISYSLILTTAHCIKIHYGCTQFPLGTEFELMGETFNSLNVLIGAHDFTRNDGYEQLYTVQSAIVHPDFNFDKSVRGYDIAVLKLLSPITPSPAVRPICFPSSQTNLPRGYPCFFAGWGKMYTVWSLNMLVLPKLLQEGQVEMDLDAYCEVFDADYTSVRHSCIKSRYTNPCFGDSGGGIFCPSENNKWFWYGAICGGTFDCLGGWTVVNNFSSVHSWIRDSVLSLGL
uniref:Chymotrypsin-like elastase family member 2A n=2 Tax=Schistocephalus solidus TaxID=70667 RepID=A0A0X3P447_SCHSO